MVAHGAGAAGALALMVLGYWVVHRLTPEALNILLLGTVFFLLVALRALMAPRREFEANWLWGALALASGYLLLVISAVFLLFEVRYPEHGFMAAFTASVSLLYFAISWRFREGAALRASRVVRRIVTLGIAGAALVYLYLSPSNGYSPPVYSAAYGAVFLAWAVLVLRHARRQGGG